MRSRRPSKRLAKLPVRHQPSLKRLIYYIVGRGRAVHILAGPPVKKRKLNAISNEDTFLINPEADQELKHENADLKARLAHAEGQLALMVNGSAQLPGLIQKFNI